MRGGDGYGRPTDRGCRLEAYIAISEVKARYCRALDTKDWEGYGDVFTDDVELDTPPAGGILTHGR